VQCQVHALVDASIHILTAHVLVTLVDASVHTLSFVYVDTALCINRRQSCVRRRNQLNFNYVNLEHVTVSMSLIHSILLIRYALTHCNSDSNTLYTTTSTTCATHTPDMYVSYCSMFVTDCYGHMPSCRSVTLSYYAISTVFF
jgi:hypothetical protein